jgi:hypothetical protein
MTISTKQGELHCLNPEDRGSKLPWNVSNYLPIDIISYPKRLDLYEQKIRSLIITNWSNLHCTVAIYREISTLGKWSVYTDTCNSQIGKDMYDQVSENTVWLSVGWWVHSLDQAFEPVHYSSPHSPKTLPTNLQLFIYSRKIRAGIISHVKHTHLYALMIQNTVITPIEAKLMS